MPAAHASVSAKLAVDLRLGHAAAAPLTLILVPPTPSQRLDELQRRRRRHRGTRRRAGGGGPDCVAGGRHPVPTVCSSR